MQSAYSTLPPFIIKKRRSYKLQLLVHAILLSSQLLSVTASANEDLSQGLNNFSPTILFAMGNPGDNGDMGLNPGGGVGGAGGTPNGTAGGNGGFTTVNGTSGINGGTEGIGSSNGGAGGIGSNGGGNGGSSPTFGGGAGGGGLDLNTGAGTGGGGGGGGIDVGGGGGGGGGGLGANIVAGNVGSNIGGAGGLGGIAVPSGGGGGGGGGGSAAVLTANALYIADVGSINTGGQGGDAGNSLNGGGGGGGAGGHGIFLLTNGNLTHSGSSFGGAGGNGGGVLRGAGQGGAGGSGIVLKASGLLNNLGTSIGGLGGDGGQIGIANATPETGGTGGHGIWLMAGGTINNSGMSSGAQGGVGSRVVGGPPTAGTGGMGGHGIGLMAGGIVTNSGTSSGGQGGIGGSIAGPSTTAGTGGHGGSGIYATNGELTNSGNLLGGLGGTGGSTVDIDPHHGGQGGQGGHGVQSAGSRLVNFGTIIAGVGGLGSNGGGAGTNGGNGGQGGDGINASDSHIINAGIITFGQGGAGGLGSGGGSNGVAGADGVAIRFTAGTNRLELRNGSMISGHVLAFSANDTFALGGDSNSSFNLSEIGPGQQYQNFGLFEKTGNSLWNLVGMSSQATNWVVKQGTLAVNGIINGTMLVELAGRLQGAGTMDATTINGLIAPGNSIGTVNILGNYTQNPGSIYQVEINPLGQSDLILVSNTAIINDGAAVYVLKEPGNYVPGTRYTILTAAGGVNGTYTFLTQDFPFLELLLNYDANHVFIDIARRVTQIIPFFPINLNSIENGVIRFANFAITPNQINTANALESLNPLDPVFIAVLNSPNAIAAQRAFDSLSGEIHSSTLAAFIEESRYIRDAAFNRLQQAFSPQFAVDEKFGYHQVVDIHSGFALWADGFGAWGNLQGNLNAAKVKRSTGGLFLGGDASLGQLARFGILGGYSNSELTIYRRNSSANRDNYEIGVYAAAEVNQLDLCIGAAHAWHAIDQSRNVFLPNFTHHLTSHYNASTAQVFAETGYNFNAQRVALEPFAGAAYVHAKINAWREFGGSASLFANGSHQEIAYSDLGLKEASQLYQGERFSLHEKIRMGWQHAYGRVDPKSTLSFVSNSLPFLISGAPIARDSFILDAGVNWTSSTRSLIFGLSYVGQWSKQVNTNGIAGNLSWHFS